MNKKENKASQIEKTNLTPSLAAKLKEVADKTHKSKSAVLREAFVRYLKFYKF